MNKVKLMSSAAAVALLLGSAYGVSAASNAVSVDGPQIAQASDTGPQATMEEVEPSSDVTPDISQEQGAAGSTSATTETEVAPSTTTGQSEVETEVAPSTTTGQTEIETGVEPGNTTVETEGQITPSMDTGAAETEVAPSTSGQLDTSGSDVEQPGASSAHSEAELAARVDEIMDQPVLNQQGEEIGDVEDLVVDQDGRVHVVVGVGGFLGIGERQIAIPAEQLQFGSEQILYTGMANAEDLKAMPEYVDGSWRSLRQ